MVRRLRDLIQSYLGCSCRPSAYYPLVCEPLRNPYAVDARIAAAGGRPQAVLSLCAQRWTSGESLRVWTVDRLTQRARRLSGAG